MKPRTPQDLRQRETYNPRTRQSINLHDKERMRDRKIAGDKREGERREGLE